MTGFTLFKDDLESQKTQYVPNQQARNIIKLLFSDLGLSKHLVSPKVLKALLIKKDYTLLKGMDDAIQEALNNLSADTQEHSKKCENSSDSIDEKEVLIGNLLSLYAFTEPAQGDVINIPVKINGVWQSVEYTVDRIQLTPAALSDPYFAYGLRPKNKDADPKLLFMGTNPIPTATGSRITKWVDLFPGQSVGEIAYKMGKKSLQEWVDAQYAVNNKKVTALGVSLGGSLSIIAHIEQPDKVNTTAYAPPALLAHMSSRYKKRLKETGVTMSTDAIKIYTHKDDFVFKVGTWFPENANIYQIKPANGTRVSKLYNHVKSYIAAGDVTIKKLDPKKVNNTFQRWVYTIIWQTIALPFFIWNVIYMGLKAALYPLNRLIQLIKGEATSEKRDAKQNIPQKIASVVLGLLAAVITLPVILVDLVVTLACAVMALVLFGLYAGISLIAKGISHLFSSVKGKQVKEVTPSAVDTVSSAPARK